MWIMTTTGFYSVVRVKRGQVQVRGRSLRDLRQLAGRFGIQRSQIIETPGADYRYRIRMTTARWAKIAAELARDAERYDNFKGAIAKTNPRRARTYEDVWWTLRVQIHGEPGA